MNEEELKKKIRRLSKENHTKYYDDNYGEDLEIDNDKEIERLKRILEGFQKAKNMFLEEIDKKLSNIDYSLDNLDNNEEFQDMEEYERDEYLSNLYGMRQGLQELKSKIGEEDD